MTDAESDITGRQPQNVLGASMDHRNLDDGGPLGGHTLCSHVTSSVPMTVVSIVLGLTRWQQIPLECSVSGCKTIRTYLRSPNCCRSSPRSSSSESKDRFLWRTIRSQERSITKARPCVPVPGEWVRHHLEWFLGTTLPKDSTKGWPPLARPPMYDCPLAITDWPSSVNQILSPRNIKLEHTYTKTRSCRHRFTSKQQCGELKMFCNIYMYLHI